MKKESFSFGFTNANIYEDDNRGFTPFVGGSAVCRPFKTVQEARKNLHKILKEEIARRFYIHQKAIEELEKVKAKLGDDEFNLGKFLVNE